MTLIKPTKPRKPAKTTSKPPRPGKDKPLPEEIAKLNREQVLAAIREHESPNSQLLFDELVRKRDEAQRSIEMWTERGYNLRRHFLTLTGEGDSAAKV